MMAKGQRGGYRPGSGRKKDITTLMRESMNKVEQHLPELYAGLIKKAKGGDLGAAIYLIDRLQGKPKIQLEAKIDPGEYLQERDRQAIAMLARQDARELSLKLLVVDATGVSLMST